MNCKKVKRRLSAYLDEELNYKEKLIVEEHLKECINCRNEFNVLSNQNKMLAKIETIEPSINFKTRFWEKIRDEKSIVRIPRLSWIPVPVMSILIAIIIFHLFSFSLTVFAKNQDLRNQIIYCTVKRFVINSHFLNPISLLNFCQDSCEILCKCAQNQGVSSKCICGKHE